MAKRRKRMSRDFDDLLEDLLDKPFEAIDKGMDALDDVLEEGDRKLDKAMRELDRKLSKLEREIDEPKKYRHKKSFKTKDGTRVTVQYNNKGDLKIATNGDLGSSQLNEIRRLAGLDKPTPPPMRTDRGRVHQPLFWKRTWTGGRGEPMTVAADSRVVVSSGGIFGRKYTVEIDGTTVYMVKNEELMRKYARRGQFAVLTHDWTEEETIVMRKILDSLDKLGIAEPYHQELAEHISPS